MSKLEWNKVGQFWVANSSIKDAAYFIDHDMDTRREGWRSTFTLAREYQLHDTLKAAKQACEDDHNARIDEIARANGYVKVQDDERVVKVADLRNVVRWLMGTAKADGVTYADMDRVLDNFTAAIDAAKENHDAR